MALRKTQTNWRARYSIGLWSDSWCQIRRARGSEGEKTLRGKTQEVVDKIGEEKGPCFINYHYKIHPKHEKNRQVPNVLFSKSSLSKMANIKTNKNKNRTPLLKTNFSWPETLSLGPKRYLHSKGPKNSICLWAQKDIFTLKVLKMQFVFGWD